MSFIVGDNIYIFGGVKSGVAGTLLKTISRFNIKTRELEELATKLPEPRAEGAAVYNSIINKGFIIGGHDENRKPLSTVWQVTINDDGSMEIMDNFPSLNYARRGCMAVNYGRYVAVLGGKDIDGNVVPYVEILDTTALTSTQESGIPNSFNLSQNHPNPFNPSTLINYQVAKESFVTLKVYDLLGREVATLVNEVKAAGKYNVSFSSSDISQSGVSSGTYFYSITAGNYSETKK